MRNDVKLGFAIGGVLLAVLIVYVLVVPGGTSQPRRVGQSTTQPGGTNLTGTQNPGVTLEPVTPATVPAVPPPTFAERPTPTFTPPTPARVDPFEPRTEPTTESVAKAQPKNDDWNAILNQPMLMTETPVPAVSGRSGSASPAPSTPVIPAAPEPAVPAPSPRESVAAPTPAPSIEPISPLSPSTQSSFSSAGSSTGSRTHRIQQGETFTSISIAAYGSPKYYPAIIKANPGVDAQHLKVGMTINLPDIATPGVRPTVSDASAQHASARVPAPAVDATKEYRVQPGDSLYKISLKLYGRSDRSEKIYQLNKQQIGEDSHRLKVGQVLQLPEPPTNTTAGAR